jgi:hypothetical protein
MPGACSCEMMFPVCQDAQYYTPEGILKLSQPAIKTGGARVSILNLYNLAFMCSICINFNVHGSMHHNNIVIYIQQDATFHSLFFWKLPYMCQVVPPPIIRSANNCVYGIWYLSYRYCYLLLLWKSWNWFECAVGGVRHLQHNTAHSNQFQLFHDSSR